jgi:hypothetical protein
MSLSEPGIPDDGHLYQLAGLTGVGWTASLLGYRGTMIATDDLTRFVTNPRSLLYLGVVLFVVTVGLECLRSELSEP